MRVLTYETYTVKSEVMSVDLILWQRFLRPMPGLLEKVFDLPQNAHLEHRGFVVLPIGTKVTIPIEEVPTAHTPIISLWD